MTHIIAFDCMFLDLRGSFQLIDVIFKNQDVKVLYVTDLKLVFNTFVKYDYCYFLTNT